MSKTFNKHHIIQALGLKIGQTVASLPRMCVCACAVTNLAIKTNFVMKRARDRERIKKTGGTRSEQQAKIKENQNSKKNQ